MVQIRIAERDARKRGELFEGMIRALLEKQGYEIDVWTPRLSHGYEVDFRAKYNDRDKKVKTVIGECKAQESNINAPTLHKFFSEYIIESKENEELEGEFYTLSPIGNGAKQVYEKIKQYYEESFHVYTSKEIVNKLEEVKILPEEFEQIKEVFSFIINRIKKYTNSKILNRKDIFLERFGKEYFWICLISGYGEHEKYFLILDNEGNIPREIVTLADVLREHEKLLNDRTYLLRDSLDLDSERLLSAIAQLDRGKNQWKLIFIDSIEILKNKGDYTTIAEIFEKIGVLRHECTEEDLYQKAEEMGDRIQSYDASEIDKDTRNPETLKLYYFAKEGYIKIENEKKVKEVSEKIKTIEEERKQEEDKEEEDMAEEKGVDV